MGTQINVTVEGRKHLGAAIGSEEYKTKFMKAKIIEWVDEIRNLSQIAKIDPHAAYSAFTHGLRHRYTYTFRTIPNIKHLLQPLADEIKDNFLPSLTNNHLCSEDERKLLPLPPKMGGLGIIIPTEIADKEFQNSDELTKLLQKNIIDQNQIYIPVDSKKLKNKIRAEKELRNKSNLDKLLEKRTEKVKKCVEISQLNGASIWLTALPIKDEGFHLNKREFWDALALRYNWPIPYLPTTCTCGKVFDVAHALSCKKGGFITMRHNEVRDITANILNEVCRNVQNEPVLQPLTGEILVNAANRSDEARLDITARNFWIRGKQAFF